MALIISEDCIACGACPSECPNDAIAVGDPYYSIDPDRCTECVGVFGTPQCQGVCPVECISQDPAHVETHDQLQAKYDALH